MTKLRDTLICLAIVAIGYFAGDIIAKGHTLNELTPYPVFGYCMWGLMLILLWVWLVQPLLQFICLQSISNKQQSADKTALRILKQLKKDKKPCEEQRRWIEKFTNVLHECVGADNLQSHQQNVNNTLAEYLSEAKVGLQGKARELKTSHSIAAACSVALSRNNLLDGLAMLFIQARLIVKLASLYGYKPSPVFNALCFSWVLGNSVLIALLDTGEIAEQGIELLSGVLFDPQEFAESSLGGIASQWTGKAVALLFEGMVAGTTVYVTASIFQRKLEGDARKLSIRDYLELRKEGRKVMRKQLMHLAGGSAQKALGSMQGALKKVFGLQAEPSLQSEEQAQA